MSSWLDRQFSSHNVQLAAAAVASGAVVAGAIYSYQAIRREEGLEKLKASIPQLDEKHHAELLTELGLPSSLPASTKEEDRAATLAKRAQHGDYDPDLVTEQLTRTVSFLGDDRFKILRESFIIVVGMGGVGSHGTSALARSGVSKIRLIDFDQVTLSSLNRHAVATLADVGTPKVECVRKRLQAVTPWVHWECLNEIWRKDEADRLFQPFDNGRGSKPDYIIDAIDNIDSKVALLQYCYTHGLKVISSMGAGCKSDPSRVYVGDISASTEDPLSRSTRRRLRVVGIASGIPVVYSTEKPGPDKAQLLPLPEDEFQKGSVNELSVLPDFRARILPVLGTMPAVFGYTLANHVILEMTNYPHEIGGSKSRDKLYDQILGNLQGCEERLYNRRHGSSPTDGGQGLRIPVTKDDIGYLIEEVFRGKSVVSGLSTRLTLIRWRLPPGYSSSSTSDPSTSNDRYAEYGQKGVHLSLDELVCMTKEEASFHEKEVFKAEKKVEDLYDSQILELVELRRKEERGYARYR